MHQSRVYVVLPVIMLASHFGIQNVDYVLTFLISSVGILSWLPEAGRSVQEVDYCDQER